MQYYLPDEKSFSVNGHEFYPDKCLLEMNLNGIWQLDVECQDQIVPNTVFKIPTPWGMQLYRVPERAIEQSKGRENVRALALPIFLDSKNEVFIFDQRAVNATGQEALDVIFKGTKYLTESNIKKVNSAYWIRKNGIEALMSDDENSFMNRWGGEVFYNNYRVIVNERIGEDRGMKVEPGFNMTAFKQSIDTRDLCTAIVPEAYNGYTLPNNQKVLSPRANDYPMLYIRTMKFDYVRLKSDVTEEDTTGLIVCDTLEDVWKVLIEECKKQWGIVDVPKFTYDVNIVDLANYPEYKDFKKLVTLNLGDSLSVKNPKYKIEQKARVITFRYDCITQSVNSLVLGDYKQDFFQKATDTQLVAEKVLDKKTNTVIAEKIQGVLNAMNTQFKAQKNSAQKTEIRAILFEDIDPESQTFGALCLGTQGIQISKKRNETNDDWIWGTAMNFEGVVADWIITGVLSDKKGNFYLDMDKGYLRMKNGLFEGDINTRSNIHVGKHVILDKKNENDAFSSMRVDSEQSPAFQLSSFEHAGIGTYLRSKMTSNENKKNAAYIECASIPTSEGNDNYEAITLKSGADEIVMNTLFGTSIKLNNPQLTISGRHPYTGKLRVTESIDVQSGFVMGGK